MTKFKSSILLSFMTFLMLLCMGCNSDSRYVGSPYTDITIYAENNENSEKIGVLYKGQKAKVIHEGWDDWYKIEFNGGEAYINGVNIGMIDENNERIWLSKGLFKGLGIGIAVLLAIGIAFILIAIVFRGLAFLFGLIMSVIVYIIGFAICGGVLGFYITHDASSTFKWIAGGAILGLIIGIVRMIFKPLEASSSGIKSVSNAYKDIKRRVEIREAEDAQRRDEEYPLEIEGTRAQRLIDGTILDEKGERWRDNGDGTVSKIG